MECLAGKRFGYWTVLDEYEKDVKGSYRWKCRCQCGTERMVLARNLRGGISQSCGCLLKQWKREQKNLTRKAFGELVVLRPEDESYDRWVCQCTACGRECIVTQRRLITGKKLHCGCKTKKNHTEKDITGQKFDMLTALYKTEKRDDKGSVVWHCRCDCGNELDLSYNKLKYSDTVSCGCHRDKVRQQLSSHLTRVDGTTVNLLRSTKKRKNSSGVTGVYLVRGKYRAVIGFQRKVYYLGTYSSLETAAAVRQKAEQLLHKEFLDYYDRWKKRADEEPAWAEENPISFRVQKEKNHDFQVAMLPEI